MKASIRDLLTQKKYEGMGDLLHLVSIDEGSPLLLEGHVKHMKDWKQLVTVLLMYAVRPQ